MEEEQINPKTFYMLENKKIKEIEIRTVGLLDVFGKIIIDISFDNNTKKKISRNKPNRYNTNKRMVRKRQVV